MIDALVLTDIKPGLRMQIRTPDGNYIPSVLHGVKKADFLAAEALILRSSEVPNTGDDDGNLKLSAPDTVIDADGVAKVELVLSGLDGDATAEIAVTAGGKTLTQTSSSNGSVYFDLSELDDGPITTKVTATDAAGAESTGQRSGPPAQHRCRRLGG